MKEIVGAKIIGELRVRMDKEAADKKCSMSEFLINLLIMNSSFIAEDIRQEKGEDAWHEIFKYAKGIFDNYKKTGNLSM